MKRSPGFTRGVAHECGLAGSRQQPHACAARRLRADHGAMRADGGFPVTEGQMKYLQSEIPINKPAAPPLEALPEKLTLDEMLQRFVHVTRGPIIVDISNTNRRLRPGEFHAAYAHNKILIGKNEVPISRLWYESPLRKTGDVMGFNPSEGRFFHADGLLNLNSWKQATWTGGDPDEAILFIEHLEFLIPDARQRTDYIDWLADAAQNPARRPHFHFLLIAAKEGTGRSWLAQVLERLWGPQHAGSVDLHRLLDDSFNSILAGKIILNVHEVKAPADERYAHRERLKSLLTDSSVTINEKHLPRWTELFCARFNLFTNRDDALPLSENDRRVYAVRCADEPKDAAYYRRLYGLLNSEAFLAGVWQFLSARDITHFNPGARAPLNEIKAQVIASGRTDEQQTAVEFVQACPFDVVGSADLMALVAPEIDGEKRQERRARMNAVAAVLRDVGCQTYARKIRVGDDVMRAWVLRNANRWTQATPAVLRDQAESARRKFSESGWRLEEILTSWGAL